MHHAGPAPDPACKCSSRYNIWNVTASNGNSYSTGCSSCLRRFIDDPVHSFFHSSLLKGLPRLLIRMATTDQIPTKSEVATVCETLAKDQAILKGSFHSTSKTSRADAGAI